MRLIRLPSGALGVSMLAYFGALAWSAPLLPERVASHFDAVGQADGWMSRSAYLAFAALFQPALVGLVLGLVSLIRFLPDRLINLPNKHYWLAAERRSGTVRSIISMAVWLSVALTWFFVVLHWATVIANRGTPARLDPTIVWVAVATLMAVIIAGIVRLYSRFSLPAGGVG